jgi:hypothetical protein
LLRLRIAVTLIIAQLACAQGLVRLKSRVRPPVQPLQAGHYVVEFAAYPGPELRQELARRGMRVLGYVPDSGLMVSTESPPDLSGLDVTWSGPLAVADKVAPIAADTATGVWLVIFHADVDADLARAIVALEGLAILENPNLLAGHLLVSGAMDTITELAEHDEVAYVLPASADLVDGVPVAGCAGALTEAGIVADYVQVGQGWAKGSDGVAALSYVFQSFPPHLDASVARQEVERAFAEWQHNTNIRFSPGTQADAARTIAIQFAAGAHGDPYPFDGPGGVLAHTFYPAPPNTEPIAGDMHFDATENWQTGWGIDVFSVALHEAGHALGLGHSSTPGAVMYPYYRQSTGLTSDDIAGIRSLYGDPSTATSQPPTTAPPPAPPAQQPPTPPPAPPTQPPAKPDTTPPSISITSPGGSIISTGAASIQVSGTASDNVAVSVVKWSTSLGDSGVADGTNNWTFAAPLYVGNTVVTVKAYDSVGNSAWRAVTVVRR